MTKDNVPDVSGLLGVLREALAPQSTHAIGASSAMQDVLNALLQRIRLVTDSEPDRTRTSRLRALSAEIAAIELPLTALLLQRLEIADPALAHGEAAFRATADARVIISTALIAGRPSPPLSSR